MHIIWRFRGVEDAYAEVGVGRREGRLQAGGCANGKEAKREMKYHGGSRIGSEEKEYLDYLYHRR
jgi:hypothetical protein